MTAPALSHPDILDPDAPDSLLDILRRALHETERARCHMGSGMARGHLANAVWHLRHAMMAEDPNALGCVNPESTCSLCAPRVRPSLFDSTWVFGLGCWPVREVVAPVNREPIDRLIDRSTVGQGLRRIQEEGIDAELRHLDVEMGFRR